MGRHFDDQPYFIFSTPPAAGSTRNFASLSLQSLRADAFTRFQRLNGVQAYHLTALDPAAPPDISTQEAARHSYAMRRILDALDISIDGDIRPLGDADYRLGVQTFFARLQRSNALSREHQATRISVPLHRFASMLRDHHRRSMLPFEAQELYARFLDHNECYASLTQSTPWGISTSADDRGAQTIASGVENAYGVLHGISEIGRRIGLGWSQDAPQKKWKIVHFLNSSESFDRLLVAPILYHLAHPDWLPDIQYDVRGIGSLGKQESEDDIADVIRHFRESGGSDEARYCLAFAAEGEKKGFHRHEVRHVSTELLIGRWQNWLHDLGERIVAECAGQAPAVGDLKPEQWAFLSRAQRNLEAIGSAYGATGFSLGQAVLALNDLVDDAVHFARAQTRACVVPLVRDGRRTDLALELASAQLLAYGCLPLMPQFAQRLADALGGMMDPFWPTSVSFVTPGAPITLAGKTFFEAPVKTQAWAVPKPADPLSFSVGA